MPVRAQSSVYDWTGFYAGVHAGGAWGKAKGSDTPPFSLLEATGQSIRGGFGGGQFGYNLQFGRTVWGVEFSASYGDISGSGGCFSNVFPGDIMNCKTNLDWSLQLLTRLGYAFGDGRFLPYVTGGAVLSHVATHRHYDDGFLPENWGGKRETPGAGIGAGFQYALGNGYSFGFEYLYVDYFNQSFSTISSCGCDRIGEQGLNTQSIRFTLNYTFGAPPRVNDPSERNSAAAQTGVYDWTGFYVGGHAGKEWAKQSGGEAQFPYIDQQKFDPGFSGVQVGYNHQIGRFVLGTEFSGSLPWSGSSTEICDSTGFATCRARQEWSGLFLARLGYAADDGRFLPYVTGGLALTQLKLAFETFGVPYGTISIMPGMVFGGGFQYAFGNGWSAGLEYLYTSYSNQDFSSVAHTGIPGDYSDDQNALTTHSIRFVTNYKFGDKTETVNRNNDRVYDWSGFYAGAHGGFQEMRSKGSDFTFFGLAGGFGLTDQKAKGESGGVQFGYNHQLGRAVFGTEFSFSAGNVSGNSDCLVVPVPGIDTNCRLKEEWSGRLLTRLGYAFGDDRMLPYLVGGVAFTQFDTKRTLNTGLASIDWGGNKTATGVVAGLGIQYAFSENLSLGGEYLFTQYGAQRVTAGIGGFTTVISQNISSDTFRVVLNYKFDSAVLGR